MRPHRRHSRLPRLDQGGRVDRNSTRRPIPRSEALLRRTAPATAVRVNEPDEIPIRVGVQELSCRAVVEGNHGGNPASPQTEIRVEQVIHRFVLKAEMTLIVVRRGLSLSLN